MRVCGIFLVLALIQSPLVQAQDSRMGFACDDMSIFDYSSGMCLPRAMAGMPMAMLMLHGNAFVTAIRSEGPRGREALAVPNMEMLELGRSLGDRHYLNLEVMGTAEKWTFPQRGYPELLQIGEEDHNQQPFIDAQHPHSSPLMGLTFSDTISLDSAKDYVKILFAPRGSSTDGPIAFMHRETGQALNPDAPLGHHIGQDVGHISSTVLGASWGMGSTRLEASTFNGREPQPEKVDLPMYLPNSWAVRVIREFSPSMVAMASVAQVENPEPLIARLWRTSASLYSICNLRGDWRVVDSLIYGQLTGLNTTSALNSFTEELALTSPLRSYWTRIEVLQRTEAQLEIPSLITTQNDPAWLSAVTLGLTQRLWHNENLIWNVGVSVTRAFLGPQNIRAAYNGDPWSEKVFVQLSGSKMLESGRSKVDPNISTR